MTRLCSGREEEDRQDNESPEDMFFMRVIFITCRYIVPAKNHTSRDSGVVQLLLKTNIGIRMYEFGKNIFSFES